ncbi:MAG: response regulator [Bdellovibrionota bacterium]
MTQSKLKSILVIEDDHDTRVSMRQQLEADGFFVFSAANGQQGIEILKRIKQPCLILLDLVMPVMDGETFVKTIEADPELHMIPVVLVTAFPDKAKPLIASALVQKPINLKTLLEVVHRHCSHP